MSGHQLLQGPHVALIGVLLVGVLPRSAQSQLASAREYEVKAGFVFNFAQFVE